MTVDITRYICVDFPSVHGIGARFIPVGCMKERPFRDDWFTAAGGEKM